MAQIMSPTEASGQNTNVIEITDSDDEDTPAQQAPTRLTSTHARRRRQQFIDFVELLRCAPVHDSRVYSAEPRPRAHLLQFRAA